MGLTKYSAQTVSAVSGEAHVAGGWAVSPTDLISRVAVVRSRMDQMTLWK